MDESFYLMIKRDIEDVIKDIFSKYYTDAKLLEYFDYSLNSKGKLKRASLLYIIYELVGNDAKHKLKYLATSLELLHTASLIHDDIMGNSMIRRGKKCIHEKYGINAA